MLTTFSSFVTIRQTGVVYRLGAAAAAHADQSAGVSSRDSIFTPAATYMTDAPEVLIAGGGVIGSAIAYFLASDPDFTGQVVVVEPDPGYQRASTPRSVGGIRQQFSTPENIHMSAFTASFLRAAGEHLAVDGEGPDVALREHGYLFLASPAGHTVLIDNHRVQLACGADNILLTPQQLAERFPWLAMDGIAAGCLGQSGEGWLDPHALLQGFRRKARSLGVQYRHDAVSGITVQAGRIGAVRLAAGRTLHPGVLVNAAGARARELAAMAGVDLPVHPRRRQVFAIECRTALPGCPLVIDPSGLYFRPEGTLFLCGISPLPHEDPDSLDLHVDADWFEQRLWPGLAARVPAFEAVKVRNAWAGHYAMNAFDANAILGPHPEITNLHFANGFSGHGLQHSPAVGRALAEHIVHGGYRSIDLTRLAFARIAANEPVLERNVV
jgi:sarcosine oxidase